MEKSLRIIALKKGERLKEKRKKKEEEKKKKNLKYVLFWNPSAPLTKPMLQARPRLSASVIIIVKFAFFIRYEKIRRYRPRLESQYLFGIVLWNVRNLDPSKLIPRYVVVPLLLVVLAISRNSNSLVSRLALRYGKSLRKPFLKILGS